MSLIPLAISIFLAGAVGAVLGLLFTPSKGSGLSRFLGIVALAALFALVAAALQLLSNSPIILSVPENRPQIESETPVMGTSESTKQVLTATPLQEFGLKDGVEGIWDLTFTYTGLVPRGGGPRSKPSPDIEVWRIELKRTGDRVSGVLKSVNSDYSNPCANAIIEGEISGTNVSLVVTFSKGCCRNQKVTIVGVLSNEGRSMNLNYNPSRTAPTGIDCDSLSYGTGYGTFIR